MITNTTIPAIPTLYGGTQFRSRTEAKWAAYFDIVGWRWEYEPLDLCGYVPDFALTFDVPVLVEVKPIMTVDELVNGTQAERTKLDHAGWDGEALIVGSRIWPERCGEGWHVLGLMRTSRGWDKAFPYRCNDCGAATFAPEAGDWRCRAKGCYEGNGHIDALTEEPEADFRRASNEVQWRKPA